MLMTHEIEEEAVEEVRSVMRRTQRVVADINYNDKTPSWDGDLIIYKDDITESKRSLSKKDIIGKISTQVKGIEVKKLSESKMKYTFDVEDLKNYYKDNGAIVFVGQVIEGEDEDYTRKLFYKSLLPIDLKDMLDHLKEGQKTKQIELKELVKNKKRVLGTLKSFLSNRNKQPIFMVEEAKKQKIDIDELSSFTLMPDGYIDNIGEIIGSEYYLYGKRDINNIEMPINKGIVHALSHSEDVEIKVKDRIFFNKIKRIYSMDETYISFANKITFKFNENKSKLILKINNESTNLSEILLMHEFLIELYENKCFQVSDFEYKFDIDILSGIDIKIIKNNYRIIKEIKVLFDYFGIDENVNSFDYLTNNSKCLLLLKLSIIDGENIRIYDCEQTTKIIQKINDKDILLLAIQNENGEFKLYDFFSNIEKVYGFFYKDEDGNFIKTTPFISLDRNEIQSYNFDELTVYNSILKLDFNQMYGENIILFILELIHVYDKYSVNRLELALRLLNYLEKNKFNEDILTINKCQILKRLNYTIPAEDKSKLFEIREKNGNNFKCAVCLILEEFISFEYYFSLLNEEEEKEFKEYPIYNLYRKM